MLLIDYSSPRITEDTFKAIMDLCFLQCEYFSLTIHRLPQLSNLLQVELEPYLHREIKTTHWFCFYRKEDNPLSVMIYPVNDETRALVEEFYTGLFLNNSNEKNKYQSQNTEDLCFFLCDKLILGSVSHEYICQVFPPDRAFESQLLALYSHWQKSDDYSEQIRLSDYIVN